MNYNYEKGKYAQIPFEYNDESKTLKIGKRTGKFDGMLENRTFTVVTVSKDKPQPFNLEAKSVTVHYDGNEQVINL